MIERPPDRVCTVPGPRGKTWTVHVYYGDVPWEVGWPRVEAALMRMLLPKLREIVKRDRVEEANDGWGDESVIE